MLPSIKDLVMYVNKKLTGNDWNTNFQKIVNWLTGGNTDIKVKSIEISQDGGLVNNGSLTQSGDLSVTGNISTNGNLTVDGIITGDGSGLTGVVSAATIAYTPFCVNNGYKDSNGKGDLFNYISDTSTSIEFKVDDGTTYKPITFTDASGKTTTLNAINSYDLSQTDPGTYLVYLTENATAVTLSDNGAKVYYRPKAPSSPSSSDIWLDTSGEGLKSYIRQSGTWVEANIVVLGSVTVNNYKVQSATTFAYNQNHYNINGSTNFNLQITADALKSKVSASRDTVYGPFDYPVVVVVGRLLTYISGEYFQIQVSTDGSNFERVIGYNTAGNGCCLQSVVIGKGLYFKALASTSGTLDTYWYAPLWKYTNN